MEKFCPGDTSTSHDWRLILSPYHQPLHAGLSSCGKANLRNTQNSSSDPVSMSSSEPLMKQTMAWIHATKKAVSTNKHGLFDARLEWLMWLALHVSGIFLAEFIISTNLLQALAVRLEFTSS
ncbi:hypothetical protein BKA67DRAFT_657058 [Truncatella angustata]|uniref:Uncharacterized protein n=1 Tax=Truncatella angustata TaxID=152316 RepID=A0A9P8UNE2_9PEZI|nr:uncharacterized protein BKA67DRAFT_657058 [Truncatella angustata]KAH6655099.1 hypothetical protein BKA67DRAFT_657058 [Truncatella angustata]